MLCKSMGLHYVECTRNFPYLHTVAIWQQVYFSILQKKYFIKTELNVKKSSVLTPDSDLNVLFDEDFPKF